MTFLCGAEGQPTPKIAWFKDGKQILSGGRYDIQNGNLVILNVQRDDVGNYTCTVSNKAGMEETRATIEFVYGKYFTMHALHRLNMGMFEIMPQPDKFCSQLTTKITS